MDTTKYGADVVRRIKKTEELRFTEPKEVIATAEELLYIAKQMQDVALSGLAYFCIGDAYYTMADGERCSRYINCAIRELNRAKEWQKLGECYNLLGILFAHQGDISQALNSYYRAMELVENYGLDYLGAMVYENYSELCDRSNNEEEAYRKAMDSKAYIEKIPQHPRYQFLKTAVLIRLIKTLLKLRRGEEAKLRILELQELQQQNPTMLEDEETKLDLQVLDTLWLHFQGKSEEEEESLRQTMETIRQCKYRIDFFWTCIEFMEYLRTTHRQEMLESVIRMMEDSLQEEGASFPDLQTHISKYKVGLLREMNRKEELFYEYERYFHYIDLQKKQSNSTIGLFLETQNSLLLSQKTNMILREQVDTDELTGIANRRKLNETLDSAFDRMYSCGKLLGVVMMDIDKFKEVNDTYGHTVGDRCLEALAHALSRFQDEDTFCARYGGDEFFLVFTDKDEWQIRQIGRMISMSLQNHIHKYKLPKFTISMGVGLHVPQDLNKLWDFTSLADKALYAVKSDGGNGILIVEDEEQIDTRESNIIDNVNCYEVKDA